MGLGEGQESQHKGDDEPTSPESHGLPSQLSESSTFDPASILDDEVALAALLDSVGEALGVPAPALAPESAIPAVTEPILGEDPAGLSQTSVRPSTRIEVVLPWLPQEFRNQFSRVEVDDDEGYSQANSVANGFASGQYDDELAGDDERIGQHRTTTFGLSEGRGRHHRPRRVLSYAQYPDMDNDRQTKRRKLYEEEEDFDPMELDDRDEDDVLPLEDDDDDGSDDDFRAPNHKSKPSVQKASIAQLLSRRSERSATQSRSQQDSRSDSPEATGSPIMDDGEPSQRLRIRPAPTARSSFVSFSDDELGQDSSRVSIENQNYDPQNPPLVTSDVLPSKAGRPRRSSRRFRQTVNYAVQTSRKHDSGSDIEFEDDRGWRRSKRANKNTKSMLDPAMDDDYYVEDDRVPVVPKIISIKEVFKPTEEGDFKDAHCTTCDACGVKDGTVNKGALIPCQGCSTSYHKVCLNYRSGRDHQVTKIGPDDFVLQCRYCIRIYEKKDARAPDHDRCQTCREKGPACAAFSPKRTAKQEEKLRQDNGGEDPVTNVSALLINHAENILFRCNFCRRAYHYEHLPAPNSGDVESDNIRASRLAEYSVDWKCAECRTAPTKVDGLVAWRPTDRAAYRQGDTALDLKEDDKEYLVKWENKSYAHCTWMPGAWIWGTSAATMRIAFPKRNNGENLLPKFSDQEAIPEEYLIADVILAVEYKKRFRAASKTHDLQRIEDVASIQVKFVGLGYDEAVWDAPPSRDSGARWTAFLSAYEEFLHGKYFPTDSAAKMKERLREWRALDFKKENLEMEQQPPGLKRGTLMKYQIEGLNWLLFNYHQEQNVILADEMGLGKTVQVVSLITTLVQEAPKIWPFLIVVPNSTCPNWRREIKHWAPDLRVVTYHGGRVPQDLAYKNELFPNGAKEIRAHVVVMSYDSAQDDRTRLLFKSVQWAGLVVDEGQRLKNDENLLYGALRAMRIPFRLLLTGTPLQNNKRELFNLLQFIDSTRNAAQLDEQYQEITAQNLPELHLLIRPYFLRRTKAEVLKFLPPMAQIIVPVSMSIVQEKLCKSIIAKNSDLIRAIFANSKMKVGERGSLNNILMQLRKCLCHPFIYSSAVEDKSVDHETMHRNLIEASSKLVLLSLMLPKLKERGHRVLIFSQFLDQLDIIEDFLNGLGYKHHRLDGQIGSLEKQKRIDAFNAPGSELFAFLLSTRAGGVGINLATADTVIILDPDFNPHQDIQALSRAHRIGQKNKVLCFQLMTKDSVEEKIMQIGRKKMALDHALIESMDADDETGNDLESILKHGAEALFSENQKDIIKYDEASVDKLLDRSQLENTKTDEGKSAESQFSFARVWANDEGGLTDNLEVQLDPVLNPNVWENILKEREEEARKEAERNTQVLGRGGRRRQAVKYELNKYGFEEGPEATGAASEGSEVDDDFVANDSGDTTEEEVASATLAPKPESGVSTPAKGVPSRKAQGKEVVRLEVHVPSRPAGQPQSPAQRSADPKTQGSTQSARSLTKEALSRADQAFSAGQHHLPVTAPYHVHTADEILAIAMAQQQRRQPVQHYTHQHPQQQQFQQLVNRGRVSRGTHPAVAGARLVGPKPASQHSITPIPIPGLPNRMGTNSALATSGYAMQKVNVAWPPPPPVANAVSTTVSNQEVQHKCSICHFLHPATWTCPEIAKMSVKDLRMAIDDLRTKTDIPAETLGRQKDVLNRRLREMMAQLGQKGR